MRDAVLIAISLIVGIVLGGLAVWVWCSRRDGADTARAFNDGFSLGAAEAARPYEQGYRDAQEDTASRFDRAMKRIGEEA